MTRRRVYRPLAAAALLLVAVATAEAQSVASRVAEVGDGLARLSFAARPGVCGHGENIHLGDLIVHRHGDGSEHEGCDDGPVRITLTVVNGRVSRVKTRVGGEWRANERGTDLGTIAPAEAAAYLFDLAAASDARAGEEAIFPATLADGVIVWPRLLELARDRSRPRETRKTAMFWLGQAAAQAAAAGLVEIIDEADDDVEVLESAVFALSLRPNDEAVPALIRMAKTSPNPAVRRSALFWLSQSDDPRVTELFEELLVGS